MKRTLPIASHPAAFASTLPPTSDNVMTIPSDISTFMTVLLFHWACTRSALYYLRRSVAKSLREFTIYADEQTAAPRMWGEFEAAVLIDSSPNDEPSPG